MKKELLFSVTAKDCRWDYFVGQGNGGQNKQKTNSAVRCTHIKSKAAGVSQEELSQELNKKKAFKRMVESKEFQIWLKMEITRRTTTASDIQEEVDRNMRLENIRIEGKDDQGKWVDIKGNELDAPENSED